MGSRATWVVVCVLTSACLGACGARSSIDDGAQDAAGSGGSGSTTGAAVGTGPGASNSTSSVSNGSSGSTSTGSGCLDEVIATVPPIVTGLAVDGNAVFWGAVDGSIVTRADSTTTILGHAQPPIRGIAVDASNVYFTAGGTLSSVPRTGGSIKTIGTYGHNPEELVADAGVVFLLDQISWTGSVIRVDADGTPTTLVPDLDLPQGLAIDHDYVYVLANKATIGGQSIVGPVLRVSRPGGVPEVLAAGLNQPSGIAVDATHVYFVDRPAPSNNSAVRSVEKNSKVVSQIGTTPYRYYAVGVAVDDKNAYVTAYSDFPILGSLRRMALDGSSQKEIATSDNVSYDAVRLSDQAIFWTNGFPYPDSADGPSVLKQCK